MAPSLSKLVVAGILATSSLAAAPAAADVFSSQGFSGETTSLEALPGVNLGVVPGASTKGGNCREVEVPAYARGRGGMYDTWTECQVGNFTFSTTGDPSRMIGRDPTYNFQPPPWEQGWRP